MTELDEPVGSARDPRSDHLDYRPDLSGRVEANFTTREPPAEMVEWAMAYRCPHCLPNLFIEEIGLTGEFEVKIAHDDACPVPVDG